MKPFYSAILASILLSISVLELAIRCDANSETYVAGNVRLEEAILQLPTNPASKASYLFIVDPEDVPHVDAAADSNGNVPGSVDGDTSGEPPDNARRPGAKPQTPIALLASNYMRDVVSFGRVDALVPRAMTVLNMPVALDHSSGDIPFIDEVKLFLASLSDDQWTRLQGMGLSPDELSSQQQELYTALLTHPVDVVPANTPVPRGYNDDWKLSQDLYYANVKHLDVADLQSAVGIHIALGPSPAQTQASAYDDPPQYDYCVAPSSGKYYTNGVDPLEPLAITIRTARKESQLTMPRTSATVALKPRQDVGEIVASIAKATNQELHCDPRYAQRNVDVIGKLDTPANAADVADALRMSLRATWRKVGPAYVLTDDLAGYGTRRRAICSTIRSWSHKLDKDLFRANRILAARLNGTDSFHVCIDIPQLGRVKLDDISTNVLNVQSSTATAPSAVTPTLNGFEMSTVAQPATTNEAKDAVDKVALSGDTSIYLDVFHHGKTFFASKAIPPVGENGAVLDAAIAEANTKKLKLYAVVDLLKWATPGVSSNSLQPDKRIPEDTTIDGLTAREAMAFDLDAEVADADSAIVSAAAGNWVSSAEPNVKELLSGVCRELASTNNIAGIVLRDVCPPGYGGAGNPYRPVTVDLGYSEAVRLAYLRATDEDPIDIDDPNDDNATLGSRVASLDVLGFHRSLDAAMSDITQWINFRHRLQTHFVSEVVAEIHKAAPTLTVYVETSPEGPIALPPP